VLGGGYIVAFTGVLTIYQILSRWYCGLSTGPCACQVSALKPRLQSLLLYFSDRVLCFFAQDWLQITVPLPRAPLLLGLEK
jgi:hypothetical protein